MFEGLKSRFGQKDKKPEMPPADEKLDLLNKHDKTDVSSKPNETPDEGRLSIPDIFKNPRMNKEFAEMARILDAKDSKEGDVPGGGKYAKSLGRFILNKTEKGDTETVTVLHQEYLRHLAETQKFGKDMTGEWFDKMQKASPRFAALCSSRGAENIKKVIREGVREDAFKEALLKGDITKFFDSIKAVEEKSKDADAKARVFCLKHGLKIDEFKGALLEDGSVDAKKLQEMVHGKLNWFGKFLDLPLLPGKSGTSRVASENLQTEWKAMVEGRRDVLDKQGSAIAGLFGSNDMLRGLLDDAVLSQNVHALEGIAGNAGYADIKDVAAQGGVVDEALSEALKPNNVETFMARFLQRYAEEGAAEGDLELALDEFLRPTDSVIHEKLEQPMEGKRGFWATILGFVFRSPRDEAWQRMRESLKENMKKIDTERVAREEESRGGVTVTTVAPKQRDFKIALAGVDAQGNAALQRVRDRVRWIRSSNK